MKTISKTFFPILISISFMADNRLVAHMHPNNGEKCYKHRVVGEF